MSEAAAHAQCSDGVCVAQAGAAGGVGEYFSRLFDTSSYPARWSCGTWTPFEGWLHITSDLVTFAAYTAIPLVLAWFIIQRRDVPFTRLFWIFAGFIFFCGITHGLEALIFWQPVYRLSGLAKLATATVSVVALVSLVRVAPKALALPGLAQVNATLEQEVLARRESERQLSRQNDTLELLGQQLTSATRMGRFGYWEWHIATDTVHWSDSLYELMEIAPGTVIDYETNRRLYTPESFAVVEREVGRLVAHGGEATYRVQRADPSVAARWFEAQAHAVEDGGRVIALRGTVQDITARKEAEGRLLEQQQQLLRANEDLAGFAYAASHDLREPIRKARFFSDRIAEADNEADRADCQTRLAAALDRMAVLVDDMLLLAQSGAVAKSVQTVDCDRLVDEVLADVAIPTSGNAIQRRPLPLVLGDGALLRQVFANIVGNAVKYRDPQRPLRLDIGPVACDAEGRPGIAISDHGIGFDAEHADLIFKPFQRLHPKSRIQGTGIGLTICRKIVEGLGGTIRAEGRPGAGATVIIHLPPG